MSFLRSLASYYRRNVLFSSHHAYPVSAAFDRRSLHSTPEIKINPSSYLNWAKWLAGSLLAAALPFWNKSWKRLLRLEDEAEIVVDAVENAAEVVEKVAAMAEQVSSDVAEKMQEDGRLKGAVLFVEKIAKEAAEEARLTQDIIHKVDELKDEMQALIDPMGKEKEKHVGKDEGHRRKGEDK